MYFYGIFVYEIKEVIMPKQMYLQFPLKTEHVKDFLKFCNSSLGFALTKKQPGFISSEWMISESENGQACFHLWEKWESAENFNVYMETPERIVGSKFEISLKKWAAGKTKIYWGNPKMV